mmetsp:Transcript_7084/g.15489  ORF Transcript_7084/g.15489 Transcript_7084/m.15489 type:complete len:271 (+) Transcript_7084:465-1277(+)
MASLFTSSSKSPKSVSFLPPFSSPRRVFLTSISTPSICISMFFFNDSSVSFAYASLTASKASRALGTSRSRSGCTLRDILRNRCLMSSSVASQPSCRTAKGLRLRHSQCRPVSRSNWARPSPRSCVAYFSVRALSSRPSFSSTATFGGSFSTFSAGATSEKKLASRSSSALSFLGASSASAAANASFSRVRFSSASFFSSPLRFIIASSEALSILPISHLAFLSASWASWQDFREAQRALPLGSSSMPFLKESSPASNRFSPCCAAPKRP